MRVTGSHSLGIFATSQGKVKVISKFEKRTGVFLEYFPIKEFLWTRQPKVLKISIKAIAARIIIGGQFVGVVPFGFLHIVNFYCVFYLGIQRAI